MKGRLVNAALRRVVGLVRKEAIQMLRDPSSILIGVILPLVLLFLFGVGVSLDLRRVAIGFVAETPTPETSSFAAALRNARVFEVHEARHRRAFEDSLVTGELKGIVVLGSDFAARSQRGDVPPVQILVDGSDPNTAGLVQNYIIGTWENWRMQWQLETRGTPRPIVEARPRVWFNPGLNSRYFLLPGSVGLIMALIGTLLTALVVAREWERGTMEALLATPAGVAEILVGKLLPYFALGMLAMGLCVAVSVWGFGVPLRGSVGALSAVSAVFLVAMLALGLLISTLARDQFVASQFAIVAAFLPAFLLSGFIFEITSMPWPIRAMTRVLPARYLVSSLQTIFLAGDVASVLIPNLIALGLLAGVLLVLVARTTRTTLD